MKNFTSFSYENLFFRLLDYKDLKETLAWRNHPEYRQWFMNTHIINLEEHLEWFNNYSKNDNDYIFIVECDSKKVGQISLYNINAYNKSCEFGRLLANPQYSGKGYMQTAVRGCLEIADKFFKIKRLSLEVKKANSIAIHIYKHNGFNIIEVNADTFIMELFF